MVGSRAQGLRPRARLRPGPKRRTSTASVAASATTLAAVPPWIALRSQRGPFFEILNCDELLNVVGRADDRIAPFSGARRLVRGPARDPDDVISYSLRATFRSPFMKGGSRTTRHTRPWPDPRSLVWLRRYPTSSSGVKAHQRCKPARAPARPMPAAPTVPERCRPSCRTHRDHGLPIGDAPVLSP